MQGLKTANAQYIYHTETQWKCIASSRLDAHLPLPCVTSRKTSVLLHGYSQAQPLVWILGQACCLMKPVSCFEFLKGLRLVAIRENTVCVQTIVLCLVAFRLCHLKYFEILKNTMSLWTCYMMVSFHLCAHQGFWLKVYVAF